MIVYLFVHTNDEYFFVLSKKIGEIESLVDIEELMEFLQGPSRDLIPMGAANISILKDGAQLFEKVSYGGLTTLAMAGLIDEVVNLGKLRW